MGQEKVGTASFSVGNASHSHPVSTGWPRTHGTLRTVLTVSQSSRKETVETVGEESNRNSAATRLKPGEGESATCFRLAHCPYLNSLTEA